MQKRYTIIVKNNPLISFITYTPYAKFKLLLNLAKTINGQLGAHFSPDSSGILTPTMAMRTMAGGGIEITGTLPDKVVCTPSTS